MNHRSETNRRAELWQMSNGELAEIETHANIVHAIDLAYPANSRVARTQRIDRIIAAEKRSGDVIEEPVSDDEIAEQIRRILEDSFVGIAEVAFLSAAIGLTLIKADPHRHQLPSVQDVWHVVRRHPWFECLENGRVKLKVKSKAA